MTQWSWLKFTIFLWPLRKILSKTHYLKAH